jgi:hypothetical protein
MQKSVNVNMLRDAHTNQCIALTLMNVLFAFLKSTSKRSSGGTAARDLQAARTVAWGQLVAPITSYVENSCDCMALRWSPY